MGEVLVEGKVRLSGAEAAVGTVLVELGLLAVEGTAADGAFGEVPSAVETVCLDVRTACMQHAVGSDGDVSSTERALL